MCDGNRGSVTMHENGFILKNRFEAKDTSVYVEHKMAMQHLVNAVLAVYFIVN